MQLQLFRKAAFIEPQGKRRETGEGRRRRRQGKQGRNGREGREEDPLPSPHSAPYAPSMPTAVAGWRHLGALTAFALVTGGRIVDRRPI